ncbi:MAG: hypothetical protein AMJ43_02980 [Coxiella sp. DG_40]|nr:MAG: hypothetical protein AMJ43_02980 [Coxiella sp. DG_40]
MKITINSSDIPKGHIKCVTYDGNSNPSKLIFSMCDKESAQRMSLAVTNLLGLTGHYDSFFKTPILSESVVNNKEVQFVIKGNEVGGAVKFLENLKIITIDLSRIVLERIKEDQEIEDICIVEVTPQS